MDTLDFRLTDVPQNLTEALNLTEGENVVLQNIDKTAVGFFRESAAVPSSSAKAFQVPAWGELSDTRLGLLRYGRGPPIRRAVSLSLT